MSNEEIYSKSLGILRALLARFKPGEKTYDEIVAPRDQVFAMFKPIFSTDHVPNLTKEEFTSFLYFDNNRHWSGLYRTGLGAAADMETLRRALGILLDEGKPIGGRFSEAIGMVPGFGKAIATAILTVAYPDLYGVWNNSSEAALRQMSLWPNLEKGQGIGGRYAKINDLLRRLSQDLVIDLWTLDALWWFFLEAEEKTTPPEIEEEVSPISERFRLERQLEEFMIDNWDRTPLAKEWAIYSTADDPYAGSQFPTDIGRIDILAVRRDKTGYLVVELKRGQTTDDTVGQALRYVGWIQKNLAEQGQTVEGLIIAHDAGKQAQYALLTLPNVKMMTYEVEFRLKAVEPLE